MAAAFVFCVPAKALAAAPPEIIFNWSIEGNARAEKVLSADGRAFVLMRRSPLPEINVVDTFDKSGGLIQGPPIDLAGSPTDMALLRTSEEDATTHLPIVREALVVTSSHNRREVVTVNVSKDQAIEVAQVIDLPGGANATSIQAVGEHIFIGRARSAHPELYVFDRALNQLAAIEVEDSIDSLVISEDRLYAIRRDHAHRFDVSSPGAPIYEGLDIPPPGPEPPVAASGISSMTLDGPFAYYALSSLAGEVAQIHLRKPLSFPDRNGDGELVLGCVGDSNSVAGPTKWCDILEELVDDASFRIVNTSASGATAIPETIHGGAILNTAYEQMPIVLEPSAGVDAIILAFGTNDTNQNNFDADPALFDAQIQYIVDALAEHKATAEAAGLEVFVATTPPRIKFLFGPLPLGHNERIVALNQRIEETFDPAILVDFYDLFYASYPTYVDIGADGIHVTEVGQQKRALRAFEALTR